MLCRTTSTQDSNGKPSQSKQARKINKRRSNREWSRKITSVLRWHDLVCIKPDQFYRKKILEQIQQMMKKFSKVAENRLTWKKKNQLFFYTLAMTSPKGKLCKKCHLQKHLKIYLELKLSKEVKVFYTGKYKTLKKEIKKATNT